MRVFVHVSTVCRRCTHYPCDFALSASPPLSVPSQRSFCAPLNYTTFAEWSGKKGKREFYNNRFPLL